MVQVFPGLLFFLLTFFLMVVFFSPHNPIYWPFLILFQDFVSKLWEFSLLLESPISFPAFPIQWSSVSIWGLVAQWCPTLCDPMDCSPRGVSMGEYLSFPCPLKDFFIIPPSHSPFSLFRWSCNSGKVSLVTLHLKVKYHWITHMYLLIMYVHSRLLILKSSFLQQLS